MLFLPLLLVPAAAMPLFDINLDLPPKQRWVEVVHRYKPEMIAILETVDGNMKNNYNDNEKADWLEYANMSEEYLDEMHGMYKELGPNLTFSVDALLFFNLGYERTSPNLKTACSGLLAADMNGKVIHGRNMDFEFKFQMPDGTIKDLPDVTFEAHFWKGGQRIFMSIHWPLYVGVHSGMRFNGWTFEQNTRWQGNDAALNLAAAKEGGQAFGVVARKLLETVPDFESALAKINGTSFMAPQYFILAGAKANEGAIITMDRGAAQSSPSTPPVQRLGGPWFLLQTNDDVNKVPLDLRRPATSVVLAGHNQQEVSTKLVWDVMHHWPLTVPRTIFTWVAVPSTNYSQAVLRGEEPLETEEVQLLQRFLSHSKGWTHVISQHGLRLQGAA
eukprot:Skav200463  [mRNA]  locus=scaffold5059:92324:93487:- [translate_table: standard]